MSEPLEDLGASIRYDQTAALLKRIERRETNATLREFLLGFQIAAEKPLSLSSYAALLYLLIE
jgi:hypothetical protein